MVGGDVEVVGDAERRVFELHECGGGLAEVLEVIGIGDGAEDVDDEGGGGLWCSGSGAIAGDEADFGWASGDDVEKVQIGEELRCCGERLPLGVGLRGGAGTGLVHGPVGRS